MAADKIFHVLTDFEFEVAGAITSTKLLQDATQKISDKANMALSTLNKLGDFISSTLGLNLGLVGLLTGAITSSEKFTKSQLSLSNILSANMDMMQGDVGTFNDRLAVSEKIIKEISKVASKFSLDESSLFDTTKMLGAMLAPKGLTGNNFGNAIDLARKFEKSAPTLGVDTGEAQGQLIRLIEGHTSMQDTLFRRLLMETHAFTDMKKQGVVKASNLVNAMPVDKRFDLIQKAMGQFASDTNVLAGNAMLLSNQLMVLKNIFIGLNGILKPLGDVIVPNLKKALFGLNTFLNNQGRTIAANIARFIEPFISNPEQIYASLRQLGNLKKDLASASSLASGLGLASMIFGLGKWLMGIEVVSGAVMSLVQVLGLAGLAGAMSGLWASMKVGAFAFRNMGTILMVIGRVGMLFARFTFITAFFVGLFQLISRARALADIIDLKKAVEISGDVSDALLRMVNNAKTIFLPFYILFDDLAQAIAPLFSYTFWLTHASDLVIMFSDGLQRLSDTTVTVVGFIYGLASAWGQFMADLGRNLEIGFGNIITKIATKILEFGAMIENALPKSMGMSMGFNDALTRANGVTQPEMNTTSGILANMGTAFDQGMNDFFARVLEQQKDMLVKDKNVSQQNTNIGKIEIRQDFKENMEPDRIAMSLMKVLQDVATNPTQATNRSINGPSIAGNH